MKANLEIEPAGKAGSQFKRIESGIFRNESSGTYFERPTLDGRRTWRSLETQNLKHAREEFHRRRAGVSKPPAKGQTLPLTVGDILRRYEKDG